MKKYNINQEQINIIIDMYKVGIKNNKIAEGAGVSAEFIRKILIQYSPDYCVHKLEKKGKCYNDYLKEAGLPSKKYYKSRDWGFYSKL